MQPVAHSLVAVLLCTASAASAVRVVANSTLGSDPQTVNRLNGESFQQDALVTFNGTRPALFSLAHSSHHHRQATSMPHFGPQTPLTHPYAIHPSRAGHSPPLSMHRIPAGRRSPLRTITRQKTMATTCASFSFLLLFTTLFAPRIMLAVVR